MNEILGNEEDIFKKEPLKEMAEVVRGDEGED